MKNILQQILNSVNTMLFRRGFVLVALASLALPPMMSAVSPPPDGSDPNGNTAEGNFVLQSLATGKSNTALGSSALFSNTTGSQNTATGAGALDHNTSGFLNVAAGFDALFSNTTGFHNTAIGIGALFSNTTGNHNTANGDVALFSNATGNFNTVDGAHALISNATGSFNIAFGVAAGENLTGNNNIDISNGGVAAESNTIRIGNEVAFTDREGIMHAAHTRTFIAGITGTTAVGGAVVFVDSSGQLGTMTSSARFKDEIKPMEQSSEAVFALKPVSFRYKKELDPKGILQFGLVAEDVAKVTPDLIVRDKEGNPYTVRYDAVNAMVLNEFLKEHRKVERLEKQVEALTAGLQKVTAQIELSKSAPQTVLNDQ